MSPLRRSSAIALFLFAVSLVASAQEKADVPAGHSMHGEAFNAGPRQAAYLLAGTGKVNFPITTKVALVQRLFDQGLGQLHGFWYWEAERSFRMAAVLDRDCAMAYWGMAMANTNNADRALGFIREARKRDDKITPRESRYIAALSDYYEEWDKARKEEPPEKDSPPQADKPDTETKPDAKEDEPALTKPPADPAALSDKSKSAKKGRGRRSRADDPKKVAEKKRKQEYLDKLEAITKDFPDDLEAKAFLAYYRWNWRDDVPIDDREKVDALLQQVFDAEPMHPAHHYRIHLWDDPEPKRALASAALCGPAAPAIAHMWHMPGHIYSKLHRYTDAVYQQEASARVDHLHMMRDRIMPYQIHNYAHNNEWLARNLVYVGRVQGAVDVAKNLIEAPRHPKLNSPEKASSAAGYGRQRLFDTLILYELWHDYIQLAMTPYLAPQDSQADEIRHIRWLAAAHLSIGNRIQGGEQLDQLVDLQAKLKTEQDEAGQAADDKAREEKKAEAEIDKAREEARKRFDSRLQAVEKAIAHLEGLAAAVKGEHAAAVKLYEKAGDLSKPQLARAYLRAGEMEKAEKLAREAVADAKNQVYPLATLVEILYAVQKYDDARREFDELRKVAGTSDLRAPIFDRLAAIAREFKYPYRWQIPPAPAPDIGARPDLERLGPFRWQPMPAVPWTLHNAEEQPISLYDYSGKPVVVLFYLGYGCLHCAEQLQAFVPLADEYKQAGIQLVAISTDSVTDLKKSMEGSGFRVQGSASPKPEVSGPKSDGADATTPVDEKTGEAASFPFTLVSNSDLRAFKAYRCFDDFEGRPLHGTFLIDKDGLIRWQEIGADPFKDAEFLLKEAKRLIALSR
ncbi:MAG TPA: redoxin domain-containing protein [Pirellulales bacterium]|nr:redoxin domain-containing protein [Pirellulales bacterium]